MFTLPIERHDFGRKLNEIVSPAQPIQSIEHLFGRKKELDRIDKALFVPGRHIFIYGDRGVGKPSLAATAANQFQSCDAKYIDVAGAPDATLKSISTSETKRSISNSSLPASARHWVSYSAHTSRLFGNLKLSSFRSSDGTRVGT